VAVSGKAAQTRIAVERATACGVGDHAKVILGPEIVDPRKRSIGPRDHVLSPIVIEVSVLHAVSSANLARDVRLGEPCAYDPLATRWSVTGLVGLLEPDGPVTRGRTRRIVGQRSSR